jgi:hypothetical protein
MTFMLFGLARPMRAGSRCQIRSLPIAFRSNFLRVIFNRRRRVLDRERRLFQQNRMSRSDPNAMLVGLPCSNRRPTFDCVGHSNRLRFHLVS